MTVRTEGSTREDALAATVSEVLGPLPIGVAVCVGVGAASRGASGAGWGLLAIFFGAVLPYVLTWRMRHPADGGLPSPRTRLRYLMITVLCAAIGLALVGFLGAPRRVVVIAATVVIGVLIGALVNTRWRASNHVAGLTGAVAALSVLYGPLWLLATPLIAVLAWARVRLGRHNLREVIVGAVIGAVVGAVIPALLA
jgi:membrane-associated phospholipid phosphatase